MSDAASTTLRLAAFVLLWLGVFWLVHRLGWVSPAAIAQLKAWIVQLGFWAPLAFVGASVLFILFALPLLPLTLMGGVLFGPWGGSVINLGASIVGVSLTFAIARALGRERLEPLLGPKLKTLDAHLGDHGFKVFITLRLVPFCPFFVVNYGAGVTQTSYRDYALGSLIGMIPLTVIYTWIGASAERPDWLQLAIAILLISALALLPLIWKRRQEPPAPPQA